MRNLITSLVFLILVGVIPLTILHCDQGRQEVSITGIQLKTTDANFTEKDTSAVYPYNEIFKAIEFSEWEFISLNNGALTPSGFAKSPAPPLVLQEFQSITIEAQNNFVLDDPQQEILSGEDISSKFLIGKLGSQEFLSIEEFIATNKIYDLWEIHLIKLGSQPITTTTMILKVTIQMTDGEAYIFENEVLKVS